MITSAARFYGDGLAAVLLQHLHGNYLFSTPDALVFGRPVNSGAAIEVLRNPEWQFPSEQQDAWFIMWLEGNWRSLLKMFPYPLPLICYERRGRLVTRDVNLFSPHAFPSVPGAPAGAAPLRDRQ